MQKSIMNQKHDIFISYRRSAGWELAKLVYTSLTDSGFRVFLDTEKLFKCDFKETLEKKLKQCEIFVPILSRDTLNRCNEEDDWVLIEILSAIDNKKTIIPLVDESLVVPDWLNEKIKKLLKTNKNIIKIDKNNFQDTIKKLSDIILTIWSDYKLDKNVSERCEYSSVKEIKNYKYTKEMIAESVTWINNRALQLDSIKSECFYQDVLLKYDKLKILQIFPQDIEQLASAKHLFNEYPTQYSFVGIVDNKMGLELGKKAICSDNPNSEFYLCDISSNKFGKQLKDLTEIHSSNGHLHRFNVVIVNNVLNYYKNPYTIIKALYDVMEEGGTIIVTDFDDKFAIMYPDSSGVLSKFMSLLQDPRFSNRNTASEVYSYLNKSNFHNITVKPMLGDDSDSIYNSRKREFIDIFYSVYERYLVEKIDGDKKAKIICDWLKSNYVLLEKAYKSTSTLPSVAVLEWRATK